MGTGSFGFMFGTGGSALVVKMMGGEENGRSQPLIFEVGPCGADMGRYSCCHGIYFYPADSGSAGSGRQASGILHYIWAYFLLFNAGIYSAVYVPEPVFNGREAARNCWPLPLR